MRIRTYVCAPASTHWSITPPQYTSFSPLCGGRTSSVVIGSALNAGFISGRPRYNYGKENFKIPRAAIEKREKLRAVAARHGVDLRTAALQFSSAADVAVALVVGARSAEQIQEDYNSLKAKIPRFLGRTRATRPDRAERIDSR